MKTRAAGFLIIDLLLASVVAGLVIAAALASYRQVLRAEQQINRKNNAVFNLCRVKQQLFVDFAAMFAPQVQLKNDKDKDKEKDPEQQAAKQCFFELANQGDSFKSAVQQHKISNLEKVSFCSSSCLDVASSRRAVRITYLLEKSKTSSAVQDFYNLVRVETPVLWQTPDKKKLLKANKITVLEDVLEFAIFALKPPAKKESKDDQVEQLLVWGQKADEDKTLPLAVIIKANCHFVDKNYSFDLFIPVFSANQVAVTAAAVPNAPQSAPAAPPDPAAPSAAPSSPEDLPAASGLEDPPVPADQQIPQDLSIPGGL